MPDPAVVPVDVSEVGRKLVYEVAGLRITIETDNGGVCDLLKRQHSPEIVLSILAEEAKRNERVHSLNDGSVTEASYQLHAERLFPPDGKIPSRHPLLTFDKQDS